MPAGDVPEVAVIAPVAPPSAQASRHLPAATLRLGYVPLVDAAPLLVADELGLFQARGLRAALFPQPGWAAIRDRLVSGALEAAHLLSPMPIAAAAGLSGLRATLPVTATLGRNGNMVVVSEAVWAGMEAEAGSIAERLAAVARRRCVAGTPLRLAVVFAFSSHNYLLRHLLAEAGLDPDRDVALQVVPPPLVAEALAEGRIDGFCAGEPWGSHARAVGAGRIVLPTAAIWPGHPEKVLGFAAGLVAHEPELVVAATAAVLAASAWLDDPRNRADAAHLLAGRMAGPGGVKLSPELMLPALQGQGACPPIVFQRGGASCPRPAHALIWFRQMRRWGHLPKDASEELVAGLWRPDLWARAARLAGLDADPPAREADWPPSPDPGRTSPSLPQKDCS